MNDIILLFEKTGGTTGLIVFIILGAVALKTIISLVDYYRDKMEKWRANKNADENKDDELEQRIAKLEQIDADQINKLISIDQTVQKLQTILDRMAEDNRRAVQSTARSTLYRLHNEFMQKGYITFAEREMYDSVSQVYLENGGNSIFKNKIIPEIEELPIKDYTEE